MVRDKLPGHEVEFHETDYMGVLTAVRDKIHLGHGLLTHPLAGSVKPGETPYRTVVITREKGALDEKSLSIIEESILTCRKLTAKARERNLTEKMLVDFQIIDYTLIIGRF